MKLWKVFVFYPRRSRKLSAAGIRTPSGPPSEWIAGFSCRFYTVPFGCCRLRTREQIYEPTPGPGGWKDRRPSGTCHLPVPCEWRCAKLFPLRPGPLEWSWWADRRRWSSRESTTGPNEAHKPTSRGPYRCRWPANVFNRIKQQSPLKSVNQNIQGTKKGRKFFLFSPEQSSFVLGISPAVDSITAVMRKYTCKPLTITP